MQEYMKRVLKRIENKNFDRKEWEADIHLLEIAIKDFLNEKGYVYKDNTIDLFRQTPEERLNETEKLNQTKAEPTTILSYAVSYYEEIFRKYLDYYNLGYLKHFQLLSNGLFYIKLHTYLMEPFGKEEERETVKKKFKKQREIITGLGIELIEDCTSYNILYSDTAIKALTQILNPFKPIRLSFKIDDGEISSISFYTRQENLDQLNIPILTLDKTTEEEAENKRIYLTKRFKELYSAISTIQSMPNMIDTCGSLIEYYFDDICNCLGIETEISEKVKERHQNTRQINTQIHTLEEDIKNKIDYRDLSKIIKEYVKRLNTKLITEIGFSINDFKINKRSYEFQLKGYELENLILFDKDLDENVLEYIKSIFDIAEAHSECYIKHSEKNLKYLMNYIKTNHFGDIYNFHAQERFMEYCIDSVQVVGTNLPQLD